MTGLGTIGIGACSQLNPTIPILTSVCPPKPLYGQNVVFYIIIVLYILKDWPA